MVVYAKEAKSVASYLSDIGWFEEDEIVRI